MGFSFIGSQRASGGANRIEWRSQKVDSRVFVNSSDNQNDQSESASSEKDEEVSRATLPRRKVIIRVAKWLIAIIVVVGLVLALRSAVEGWQTETKRLTSEIANLDAAIAKAQSDSQRGALEAEKRELQATIPRLSNLRWNWIAVAFFCYSCSLIPPGFLLHQASRALGGNPRLSTAIAAQLIGHLGKYVPGKAMVVVLRSSALARDGVKVLPATVSVFVETFLMMAVGAAVAGVVVCWLPVPSWIVAMALMMALCASIPTSPPILKLVAAKVAKSQQQVAQLRPLTVFLAGWFYSLLAWLLIGGAFTALILAIPTSNALPSDFELYATATAAIGMAMVAGFASLLPGGAGVRELVLAIILGVSLGATHALLAAIAARVLFLAVEVVLGGAAWMWLKRMPAKVG